MILIVPRIESTRNLANFCNEALFLKSIVALSFLMIETKRRAYNFLRSMKLLLAFSFTTPETLRTLQIETSVVKLDAPAMETIEAFLAFDIQAFSDLRRNIAFFFRKEGPNMFLLSGIEPILLPEKRSYEEK